MKIDIIKPRYSREQLEIPTDKSSGLVYLPSDFYSLQVSMRRLWMKPKILRLMLIMNPIGLRPHIVEQAPEYTEMDVSDQAVGESGVPPEEKDTFVTRLASKIVLRQYKAFIWLPNINITDKHELYVAVYLYRGSEGSMLYDTYSGKSISADNPLYRGGSIQTDLPAK